MYIQDSIQQWVDEYNPDEWDYTTDTTTPDLRRGCRFNFGSLMVSVQWAEYNYCDHYVGKSYFTRQLSPIFRGQYHKVSEAEVAIICLNRFDFHYIGTYGWRHFIDFKVSGNVYPYANTEVINIILRDCAAYARA